jgi:hypothetical protein
MVKRISAVAQVRRPTRQVGERYEKAMELINQLAQESRGNVILAENGKDIEAKATNIIRLLRVR